MVAGIIRGLPPHDHQGKQADFPFLDTDMEPAGNPLKKSFGNLIFNGALKPRQSIVHLDVVAGAHPLNAGPCMEDQHGKQRFMDGIVILFQHFDKNILNFNQIKILVKISQPVQVQEIILNLGNQQVPVQLPFDTFVPLEGDAFFLFHQL